MKRLPWFVTVIGFTLFAGVMLNAAPPEHIYPAEELKKRVPYVEFWTPSPEQVSEAKAALYSHTPAYKDFALTFIGAMFKGKKIIQIDGDRKWKENGFPIFSTRISTGRTADQFRVGYSVKAKRIFDWSAQDPDAEPTK